MNKINFPNSEEYEELRKDGYINLAGKAYFPGFLFQKERFSEFKEQEDSLFSVVKDNICCFEDAKDFRKNILRPHMLGEVIYKDNSSTFLSLLNFHNDKGELEGLMMSESGFYVTRGKIHPTKDDISWVWLEAKDVNTLERQILYVNKKADRNYYPGLIKKGEEEAYSGGKIENFNFDNFIGEVYLHDVDDYTEMISPLMANIYLNHLKRMRDGDSTRGEL